MAELGFSGRDTAGDVLIMHHLGHRPAGPLVEIPRPRHDVWNPVQHPLGNTPGVGLSPNDRALFDFWRDDYWRARAVEELARRGLK